MYSYIVRRIAFGAVTVVGVSIVVFFVLRVLPGDPLVAIFGPEGFTKLSPEQRARLLDRPDIIRAVGQDTVAGARDSLPGP